MFHSKSLKFSFFLLRFYLFIFRKRGEREKERGTSVCGCLSYAPLLGTWPTTQACALTGNQTGDPLVCRLALNPLSHTSQGWSFLIRLRSNTKFKWELNVIREHKGKKGQSTRLYPKCLQLSKTFFHLIFKNGISIPRKNGQDKKRIFK